MAIKPIWTILRIFAAQAAEGHAALPALANFVPIPGPPEEDVIISFGAFQTPPAVPPVPATALSMAGAGVVSGEIWIWAYHNDLATCIEEPIAKIVLAASDSPCYTPVVIRPGNALLYVTWDVSTPAGGTVTGRVHARRVGR
jgi:hypothetical protein